MENIEKNIGQKITEVGGRIRELREIAGMTAAEIREEK